MDHHRASVLDQPAIAGFVYGLGPAMQTLNNMAAEIAPTDIPILVVGESGTGKDAYAKLIHRLSPKTEAQFHKVNCASFDFDQLLNQLRQWNQNLASVGSIGTIYLDNVQELDLANQRALLSHLTDGESASSIDEFSARLISSSTNNLESEVEAGRFRRELYFRLNGARLRLPPLRERAEDIPVLAEYFLNRHSLALKKKAPVLNNNAIQTLTSYHWPGNIRELENLARKIVVFGDMQIALSDLQTTNIVMRSSAILVPGSSLKVAARAASKHAERELILQALERTRWNRKRAARELQISYKSLLYKIKQIGTLNGKQES